MNTALCIALLSWLSHNKLSFAQSSSNNCGEKKDYGDQGIDNGHCPIPFELKQSTKARWDGGGWGAEERSAFVGEGPCTIDIHNGNDLSQKQFIEGYAFTKPVVIRDASKNRIFQELTRKENLVSNYGGSQVKLSSANSFSYDRLFTTFEEYCNGHLRPQTINTLANETFYFFGDNGNEQWTDLINAYEMPPYTLPEHLSQLSFGVAGSGSGVPFHFHGPGFAETLWGRKRWFMYPPDMNPIFHPNRTTLQWLHEDYLKMKDDPHLVECTLNPGELIYFPDHWWHATLNLDASVFMSTFLSP